MLFLFVD